MAEENVTDENEETPVEAAVEPADEQAAEDAAPVAEAAKAPAEPEAEAPAEAEETEPAEATVEEAPAVSAADVTEPGAAEAAEAAPAPQSGPKPKRKRLPRSERRQRPKKVRAAATERKAIVRLPKPEGDRGRRQERQGTVVSSAMDKTIVVRVEMVKSHPKYKKVVRRSVKFHAHDEQNQAGVGDVVRIVETRPLSATKRWRLAEIVEVAK